MAWHGMTQHSTSMVHFIRTVGPSPSATIIGDRTRGNTAVLVASRLAPMPEATGPLPFWNGLTAAARMRGCARLPAAWPRQRAARGGLRLTDGAPAATDVGTDVGTDNRRRSRPEPTDR